MILCINLTIQKTSVWRTFSRFNTVLAILLMSRQTFFVYDYDMKWTLEYDVCKYWKAKRYQLVAVFSKQNSVLHR